MSNIHFVIVAGGSGKRISSSVPKQFISVLDTPLWVHTYKRLKNAVPHAEFTMVVNNDNIALWNAQKDEFLREHLIHLAGSGPERFHSVKNGLQYVKSDQIIAIHDAVRPFVSNKVIESGIHVAGRYGAAVPAIPLKESIRQIDGALSKTLDRSEFRIIQTPQFFKGEIILDAYRQSYRASFTDDASVVEAASYSIRLIEGNSENIKITEDTDLIICEALLRRMSTN